MGTSVTVIADLYIIRMDYSFTHLLTQNIVVYGRFDMGRGGVRVASKPFHHSCSLEGELVPSAQSTRMHALLASAPLCQMSHLL